MFWTAWLWSRAEGLLLIGLLALVNSFDNFLLYFGYFLQDVKVLTSPSAVLVPLLHFPVSFQLF